MQGPLAPCSTAKSVKSTKLFEFNQTLIGHTPTEFDIIY